MKAIILGALLAVSASTIATAQIRTTETRTSETETKVDSAQGKVMRTETISTVAFKEDLDRRHHMIHIDPIRYGENFNIGYQYAVTPMLSAGGTIRVPWEGTGTTGFGFSGEGRFYPGGNIFKSFHLIGNLHYDHFSFEEVYYDYANSTTQRLQRSIDPIGLEISIGWNWQPWEDFAVEFAIGGDIVMNGLPSRTSASSGSFESSSYDGPALTRTTNGMGPAVRMQIGYSW